MVDSPPGNEFNAVLRRPNMAGVLKLDIRESAEELKSLLGKQSTPTGKERVQALYLLKIGKVKTMTGLAEILGRDISTIFRWFQRYKARGLEGMLTVPRNQGRKPLIPKPVLEILKQELHQPGRFRTYSDIREWLRETHGVDASYKVVHETVRYRLKVRLRGSHAKRRKSGRQAPQLSPNLS
ncbi:helix-turn-helix domain-containing protein [Synechococcus sp. W60.1]|uniref:helix-turn-helix domain-containing protein n=2 Tax=unclassified Synechococcus TaxID=2626047 RepID=UPI0039C215D4